MKTLGFIGTGGMGNGMADNLIKAGYRLVVNDLRREQAKGLEREGARFKDSPKAVAESCELVLSMLPNNDAVRVVDLGKGGLAEATTGAKVWIDFSSIDKETIVGVSGELGKKGWTVVDASAGGVEEVAAAGALAFWLQGLVRRASADIRGYGKIGSSRRRTRQRQARQERHGDVGRCPAHEPR